jgi:hypothetical protein
LTRHEPVKAAPEGAEIERLAETQRRFFRSGATRDLEFRKRQLRILRDLMVTREADILEAMRLDLGRPPSEAYTSEIGVLMIEIETALEAARSLGAAGAGAHALAAVSGLEPCRPRALRQRSRHRTVELPAATGPRAGGRRARCRQLRGPETVGTGACDIRPDRRDDRRRVRSECHGGGRRRYRAHAGAAQVRISTICSSPAARRSARSSWERLRNI